LLKRGAAYKNWEWPAFTETLERMPIVLAYFIKYSWFIIKQIPVAWVRERTTPTERPPLVGEVSANFCWWKGVAQWARRIPYGHILVF
jgi:hypothetical protein